jgi:argininosuccinate lyase
LPSGYSRDLQETKRPLIESFDIVSGSLGVLEALFTGLEVDAARMRAAMDAGLYATDAAFELVRSGVPFREAYLRIKQGLAGLEGREPQVRLDPGATPGTPANPGLLALGGLLEELRTRVGTYADLQRQTLAALLDPPGGA